MFLSSAHDRNNLKGETQKVSKGVKRGPSVRKTYTNMHLHNSQSFQLILLNLQISVQKDASPCAGKHSSTTLEKNVLKAFFDITFVDKAVNCQLFIHGKQKRYLV